MGTTVDCSSLTKITCPPGDGPSADMVVVFFSLTEAPLPDPTPTPPNTPKRTRNKPETEPNGVETEPKWTELKLFGLGRAGGLSG